MEYLPLLEFVPEAASGFSKFVTRFDKFGQGVQLTFRRQEKHRTGIGGCCSVIYELIFLACLLVVIQQYYDVTNHTKSVSVQPASGEKFDLYGLGYRFAVQDVDPEIGTIEAWTVDWPGSEETASAPRQLPMGDCSNLLDEVNQQVFNDLTRRNGANFLCPNTTNLEIAGDYHSEQFAYIEIKVKGCNNETDSGVVCKDDVDINSATIDVISLKTYLDFTETSPVDIVKQIKNKVLHFNLSSLTKQNVNLFYMKSQV